MALPAIPTRHLDSAAHRQRISETVNGVTSFQFDDSRVMTQAEIAAGVTPVNYAYRPGDIRRYGGDNVNVVDSTTAALRALASCGECYFGGGGTYYINLTLVTTRAYIYGDGVYVTTVKNWGNAPVFTLDSTDLDYLVNVRISGMRIDNRDSGTYTAADGIYITGTDLVIQNDYHEFRDLLITGMRHAVTTDFRAIWITLDRVTSLGSLSHGFNVASEDNVDMWSWHLCRSFNSGGHGLYIERDLVLAVPIDSWKFSLCDFERSQLNGVRITGAYGIQGFTFDNCHFESNAEGIATGSTTPNRKAHVHADADYMAGLHFDGCTFYHNDTPPNQDWALYIDTSASVLAFGSVENCRFTGSFTGDVWWPAGCKLGINSYENIRVIDASLTSFDLQTATELTAFTPALTFGGASTGITYGTRDAFANLMFRRVGFSIYLPLSNKGSSVGNAVVTGLPFGSINVTNRIFTVQLSGDQFGGALAAPIFGRINPNSTSVQLLKLVGGAAVALTDSDFSNATAISISGEYYI